MKYTHDETILLKIMLTKSLEASILPLEFKKVEKRISQRRITAFSLITNKTPGEK